MPKSTFSIGRQAENMAASFLTNRGYRVLAQNWRTRTCEIDIVAHKGDKVFFVEVKYRASTRQGDGFTYITPAKIKRMNYAARLWNEKNRWKCGYELSALYVSRSGEIEFIEQI